MNNGRNDKRNEEPFTISTFRKQGYLLNKRRFPLYFLEPFCFHYTQLSAKGDTFEVDKETWQKKREDKHSQKQWKRVNE